MKTSDILSLALRNLARRKSRSFLTILSVVIGSISIIVMVSLGMGFERQFTQQLDQWVNLRQITVYPSAFMDPAQSGHKAPDKGLITEKVVEEIANLPHVVSAVPTKHVMANLSTSKKGQEIWASVMAIDPSFLDQVEVSLSQGTLLKDKADYTVLVGSNVFVMNTDDRQMSFDPVTDFDWMKEKLYFSMGYDDPNANMFQGSTSKKVDVKVAGIFEAGNDLDANAIYVSLKTAEKLEEMDEEIQKNMMGNEVITDELQPVQKKKGQKTFDQMTVQVDDMEYVQDTLNTIQNTYTLTGYSQSEGIETQQQTMNTIQLVLGGIGSIALFVAAMGITNTMLMSIHERTREIGVMKVIGAQIGDIRTLFLAEAALMSFIGGVIGVICSYGISALINSLAASSMDPMMVDPSAFTGISYIPITLALAAGLFSILIGLVAGYLPATRATRLSAIEAIRTN